jgi:hypothetical protein
MRPLDGQLSFARDIQFNGMLTFIYGRAAAAAIEILGFPNPNVLWNWHPSLSDPRLEFRTPSAQTVRLLAKRI